MQPILHPGHSYLKCKTKQQQRQNKTKQQKTKNKTTQQQQKNKPKQNKETTGFRGGEVKWWGIALPEDLGLVSSIYIRILKIFETVAPGSLLPL